MNRLLSSNTISLGENIEQYMRTFFGSEYRPGPINRSELQQSVKQQDTVIYRAYKKEWGLRETIKVLQYKVPDLSLSNVITLDELEQRLLTEVLFQIPTAELINTFGKRAAYYLFLAGYGFGDSHDNNRMYLAKQYGMRLTNCLEVARYGSRRAGAQSIDLIQQFTVLAMLQTGEVTAKQLWHNLSQDFSIQYLQLAWERAHCGAVVGYEPVKRDDDTKKYAGFGMCPNIRVDGPISIALLYKKQPVAVMSGYLHKDNSLMINQMQKVSYDYYDLHGRCTKHGVHPIMQQHDIPRQQTLFDVMKQFVSHYGITSLSIQGATNNRRTKEAQTIIDLTEPGGKKELPNTIRLSTDLAYQIYDCFAQQQGMIKNNQNNRVQTKKKK